MAVNKEEKTTIVVPRRAAAFLQRVMALPDGLHVILVLKNRSGAEGIQCWSLAGSGKVETVSK